MTANTNDELKMRRIISIREASELTSLSEDSLRRNHADKIRRLSPRRQGMVLADVLALGDRQLAGDAAVGGRTATRKVTTL